MHLVRQAGLATAYVGCLAFSAMLVGCGRAVQAAPGTQTGDTQQAAKLHFYRTEVLPVLQANCLRCHAGMNRRGGLDMSTQARLLQGGKDGAVVVLGHPENSLLARVIGNALPPDDPMRMPPRGTRLTEAQVAAIRRWIAEGVVMDK